MYVLFFYTLIYDLYTFGIPYGRVNSKFISERTMQRSSSCISKVKKSYAPNRDFPKFLQLIFKASVCLVVNLTRSKNKQESYYFFSIRKKIRKASSLCSFWKSQKLVIFEYLSRKVPTNFVIRSSFFLSFSFFWFE